MYEQLKVLQDYVKNSDMILKTNKENGMSEWEKNLFQVALCIKEGHYGEAARRLKFDFENILEDDFSEGIRILFQFDLDDFVAGMCCGALCEDSGGCCDGEEICGCAILLTCCWIDSTCCGDTCYNFMF